MTKPNLHPFINRFTGDVKVMSKADGKALNEDWEIGKVVKNKEGKKVFRFKLDASMTDKRGKVHSGTAIVDLTEQEMPAEGLEAVNEQPKSE